MVVEATGDGCLEGGGDGSPEAGGDGWFCRLCPHAGVLEAAGDGSPEACGDGWFCCRLNGGTYFEGVTGPKKEPIAEKLGSPSGFLTLLER
jgi:hypothetical protein